MLLAIFGTILVPASYVGALRRMDDRFATVVAITMPMLIPGVAVIFVILAEYRLRTWLSQRDVRLGLRGASNLELWKIQTERCGQCGYDLQGVRADVCPECGTGRAL